MAKAELTEIIEEALEVAGYELWGMEYMPGKHRALVRVYIDSPDGIGLDDCEEASRQISALLDVHDPIASGYTLEVSSPGLERPLFTLSQMQRYIGQEAKFVLYQAIQNKRRFRGVIDAVDETQETVQVTAEDGVKLSLAQANIAKTNLVYIDIKSEKRHGK